MKKIFDILFWIWVSPVILLMSIPLGFSNLPLFSPLITDIFPLFFHYPVISIPWLGIGTLLYMKSDMRKNDLEKDKELY